MYYTNQSPKLVDCRQHGAQSGNELFIVEGDAAAQAMAKQRDGRFQAVLPMQGKPMNPLHVSLEKLQDNVLYAALIQAIGVGVGETIDLESRRYERIILLMDPDADGIHCGALMTLFFNQWMLPLLQAGAVYLIRPPIGQRTHITNQTIEYTYTAQSFNAMLKEQQGGFDILKYRGLAGIPQASLETCCIDPKTRKQIQLGVQDAKIAMDVFGA